MPVIYHITTHSEWQKALQKGYYEAASLATEGFIHCSRESQVAGVLERYFKGKIKLIKLVIETDLLTSPWLEEWSSSVADDFPHIYGLINLNAVNETILI